MLVALDTGCANSGAAECVDRCAALLVHRAGSVGPDTREPRNDARAPRRPDAVESERHSPSPNPNTKCINSASAFSHKDYGCSKIKREVLPGRGLSVAYNI